MLVVFSPIFVAGRKITFVYNFVAPLNDYLQNLFPINSNSFQRKPKLIATRYILQ